MDRSGELFPMHHGGVVVRSIGPSTKPSQALLNRHPLWDQERPMHGVQFRVPVHAAVITDISPEKGTNVGIDVPFFSFCRSWNRVGRSFLIGVARVLQWLAGMLL